MKSVPTREVLVALGVCTSACQAFTDFDRYHLNDYDAGNSVQLPMELAMEGAGGGAPGADIVDNAAPGSAESDAVIADSGKPLADMPAASRSIVCGQSTASDNSAITACPLVFDESGSTGEVLGQVTERSDPSDYFAIDVLAQRMYTLELRWAGTCPANELSSEISLLTKEGPAPLVQVQYLNIPRSAIDFRPTLPGRAIVHVRGSCAYGLTLLRSTADGLRHSETFEPNNSAGSRAPLALGQSASSLVNSDTDEDDYFQLQVQAGGAYSLSFTRAAACPQNSISTEVTFVGPEGPTDGLASAYQNTETALPRDFSAPVTGLAIIRMRGSCSYTLVVNPGTAADE